MMLMKKIALQTFLTLTCLTMSIFTYAQVTTVAVQDSISNDTHWTCDKQYLIKGYVYVVNGTTLTIDSGVVIRGDKNTKGALIIERGAKIYANGTANHPVVFTSNQPTGQRTYGDWGGIILCGKSPTNWSTGEGQVEGGPRSHYGGTDPHDNSGRMSYVRIEFAGIAFSPNNEVNGLTFCSVGDQTQIDHIQVSYSGDDSFEWFGGTVNAKNIVSYRAWDDDFDTDNGFRGNVQYGVVLRDPYAADQSGSKAFESDSYQSGTKTGLGGDTSGLTRPVFANMTCIGPLVSPTSTAYDPQFVSGAQIRRGSGISILNSIIAGWPAGILVDESSSSFGSTVANLQSGVSQISGVAVAGIPSTNTPGRKEVFYVIDGARSLTSTSTWADTATNTPFAPFAGPFMWLEDASLKNKIYGTASNLRLNNPFNLVNPSFIPTSTSPVVFNNTNLPAYVNSHYANDYFGNGKKYPYNGAKPINTDTSNFFANYNAPDLKPNLSSDKLSNPFFDVVNHIGAFGYTGNTSDDWTRGWVNWDPVNTDYSTVACSNVNGIELTPEQKTYFAVFPNPAQGEVTFNYSTSEISTIRIELMDVTGRIVKTVKQDYMSSGFGFLNANVNELPAGIYVAKLVTSNGIKTTKLTVIK